MGGGLVLLIGSVLLHSTLETSNLALDLYTSESGLVALGLSTTARPKLERWLARFYDGDKVYPAEGGHEIYRSQLEEYFDGRRRVFQFPLDLRGSAFQKDVWSAVAGIPFGLHRVVRSDRAAHRPARVRAGPWALPTARIRSLSSSRVTA